MIVYKNNFSFLKKKLKNLTNEIRCFKKKTTNEGERECNRKKNRYRDILPCKPNIPFYYKKKTRSILINCIHQHKNKTMNRE